MGNRGKAGAVEWGACLWSGVRVDGDDEDIWTVGEIGHRAYVGKSTCRGWWSKRTEWDCIWSRKGNRGRPGAVECGVWV